ncbi:MAG: FAD-dependent oxidoreductase, partial [Isosphaeraceae bacterium]
MRADDPKLMRIEPPKLTLAERFFLPQIAAGLGVTARHAVVTVPPALVLDIVFDPVLPGDRRTLYRKAVAGPESKTLVVYDEPFWRADGFSGQTAAPGSVAEVTLDASPMSG